MPDDPRNDDTPSDFDDWLSEESAPPTDPYAALAEDPAEEELGEWQSFAEPGADAVPSEPEAEADDGDEHTGELPVIGESADDEALFKPIDDPDPSDQVVVQDAIAPDEPTDEAAYVSDDADETPDLIVDETADTPDDSLNDAEDVPSADSPEVDEFVLDDADPIVAMEAFDGDDGVSDQPADPVVEFEAFDGGTEPDTTEVEIIAPASVEPIVHDSSASTDDSVETADSIVEPAGDTADTGAVIPFEFPEAPDDSEFDPFEDTGEAVFVASAGAATGATSFADLWDDAPVAGEPTGEGTSPQDFVLDEDDLLHGATREHTGLAAAIAAAETEDTEQVALVAEIPGLETAVVGFEDVVEAEGHRRVRARASGDLIARVVTGVVLVLALAASLVWRPALLALAVTVFVLGAGEFYTALARSGRKPIALFGFVGIVGASLGAYFWSAAAIPIAFLLATVLLLLFYAVVPGKIDPLGNLALTATVMVWAGLGSFALLIARSDDHYQVLILGVVVAVAAADVGAFFVGRSLGRTHFAPWVSPKKTVEGLVAGSIVAIAVGAGLEFFEPFELTSGLAIGAAAAVFTPLGDLAMSAAKRSLGIKDMGSVLPGHGGFLDRIDGLLFTIPVAWAILMWAGLL
jgi:phosphatidate cytidylyltransferase